MQTVQQRVMRWKLTQLTHDASIEALSQALGVQKPFPISLSNILFQRGINTYESAKKFFVPSQEQVHDPWLMKDIHFAINRLLYARESGEKILLIGDYDVDGTTAVALCTLCLQDWGFDVSYYIPDRYKEGYGISFDSIDYAAHIEAQLIITLDCGIKAIDKIDYANTKEIDVIICDHHTPGRTLPAAYAVLDPKQPECEYPFKELSGCGVAWKLMEALYDDLCHKNYLNCSQYARPIDAYSDLITLSIASDIVPITGENRIVAYHGLRKLQTDPLPGIKAIMALSTYARNWDIADLVFFIGPRVNAAGRLLHASQAVDVLLGRTNALAELASALHDTNAERQNLDKLITQEALDLIQADPLYNQKHSTVLYNSNWHKGVIGIVASRLIEYHYRPTVVLTESDDLWVGSARSIAGFDLYEALKACQDCFERFGGHTFAAGLSIKKERIEEFVEKFDQVVAQRILPSQKVPTLYIDHLLDFSEIDDQFVRLITRMAPFGPGNPTPVFATRGVEITYYEVLKGEHLKLQVCHSNRQFEAIGFNMAHLQDLMQHRHIDIAYQATFNVWKDRKIINLQLKDIKPHNLNG